MCTTVKSSLPTILSSILADKPNADNGHHLHCYVQWHSILCEHLSHFLNYSLHSHMTALPVSFRYLGNVYMTI